MKKNLPLLIIVFLCSCQIGIAQNFRLFGSREFNPNNWVTPVVRDLYQANDGTIYSYLRESSGGFTMLTNELARYNPSIADWEDLTNNTFILPISSIGEDGVGQPDGSVITVTSGSGGSGNPAVLSHRLFPDATFEDFGADNMITSVPNGGSAVTTMTQSSTSGNLYTIVGIGFGANVFMYDGTAWSQIPTQGEIREMLEFVLGVDENDNLYLMGQEFDTGIGLFYQYDGTQWTLIEEFGGGDSPGMDVISSDEIYLAFNLGGGQTAVALYDGESVTQVGANVSGTQGGTSDIIKASNGALFLATSNANGFYTFNTDNNTWESFTNDVADGGTISGFFPTLQEFDGFIYNSYTENTTDPQVVGITTIIYNQSVLSVEDTVLNTEAFTISPNPSEGIIQVTLPTELSQSRIKVYDLLGRAVYQENIQDQVPTTTINLATLSSGVYIVNLTDSNNQILESRKLIIR